MALKDLFRKNKDNTPEPDAAPAPQAEPEVKPVISSQKAPEGAGFDPLKYIAGKYPEAQLSGDSLYFPDHDLTMKVRTGEIQSQGNAFTVQLLFILTHPFFEEELVESCAGMGSSPYKALQMGTDSFEAGVLTFVLAALKCTGDNEIEAKVGDDTVRFRVPDVMAMLHIGPKNVQNTAFWELLRDEIAKYLGRQKAYWIKMYAGWTGKDLVTEVRINGVVYPDLTARLRELAGKPDDTENYASDKQFVLLIQKDETFVPAPYTKEQVKEQTYAAIEKMMEIEDQESYQRVMTEIIDSCPWKSLGYELAAFIPEMYTGIVLNIGAGDGLNARKKESGETVSMKRSQVRSFSWIDSAVYRYIREKKPGREENLKVMGISSRFRAVHQAILNGSKMEDLVFSEMMYNVPEDYEII
ncbi:MAG TPA: hypothetical protein DCZ71_05990 [Ruminococcus sp.]|nr:hypothetical protein [Ruminococcus sp.]